MGPVGRGLHWVRRLLVGQTPCVTFATVGELLAWPEVWPVGAAQAAGARRLAAGRGTAAAYDEGVAAPGDTSRAEPWPAAGSGRRTTPWIAAVCVVRRLPLLTYNQADFADYVKHEDLGLL